MAALPFPEPGTEHGPCATPCTHPDCAALRKAAESECVYCGKPIGYGVRCYGERSNQPGPKYSHAACAEYAAANADDPTLYDDKPDMEEPSPADVGVWLGVFRGDKVVMASFDGYTATCVTRGPNGSAKHFGRNALGAWAVVDCFRAAGLGPHLELIPPGGRTKAAAVEAELDACIAVAGAALHRADLPGIIAGLRARKAPKTPELPGVAVEKEPDASELKRWELENCAGCRARTPFWTKLPDRTPGQQVALCEDCAKTMKPSEVPTKRAWCEKERALSPVRGR